MWRRKLIAWNPEQNNKEIRTSQPNNGFLLPSKEMGFVTHASNDYFYTFYLLKLFPPACFPSNHYVSGV